jgi:hypothetical protein
MRWTTQRCKSAGLDPYRTRPYVRLMTSITDQLDPTTRPFLRVSDLPAFGFGDRKTVYAAIHRGDIPVVRVGRKVLVPTAWVRRSMQLDGPGV